MFDRWTSSPTCYPELSPTLTAPRELLYDGEMKMKEEVVLFDDKPVALQLDGEGTQWITTVELADLMQVTPRNLQKRLNDDQKSELVEFIEGKHFRWLDRRTESSPIRGNDRQLLWSRLGALLMAQGAVKTPPVVAVRAWLADLGERELTGRALPAETSLEVALAELSGAIRELSESNKTNTGRLIAHDKRFDDLEPLVRRVPDAAQWAVAKERREAEFERRLSRLEDQRALAAGSVDQFVSTRLTVWQFQHKMGLRLSDADARDLGHRARDLVKTEATSRGEPVPPEVYVLQRYPSGQQHRVQSHEEQHLRAARAAQLLNHEPQLFEPA